MKTFRPGEVARAEDVNANFNECSQAAQAAQRVASAAQTTANAAIPRSEVTTFITQKIQSEVSKATGTALSIGQSVILGQQSVNFINDNIKYETVSIPRQANNRYHVFVTCEALGNVVYAASVHQKEVDKFYLRVAQVNATRSNATVLVNYMIIKAS